MGQEAVEFLGGPACGERIEFPGRAPAVVEIPRFIHDPEPRTRDGSPLLLVAQYERTDRRNGESVIYRHLEDVYASNQTI